MWKTGEDKLAYFLNLMLLFHKIACSQVYFVFPTLTKHCGSHDQCFNQTGNSNYGSKQTAGLYLKGNVNTAVKLQKCKRDSLFILCVTELWDGYVVSLIPFSYL